MQMNIIMRLVRSAHEPVTIIVLMLGVFKLLRQQFNINLNCIIVSANVLSHHSVLLCYITPINKITLFTWGILTVL